MVPNENYKPFIEKGLAMKVISRYFLSLLFMGVLIFLPAGSIKFWNGWLLIGSLYIPMLLVMIFLLRKDPELLQKRLNMKEKEKTQKMYLALSIIYCFAAFMIPGFDFRYHWSEVPLWLVITATGFMLAGYVMFVAVMIQNRYASRVIEIQRGQKVIDTGLYSIVRHPMYTAATILFGLFPLVLGSYYTMILVVLFPFLLIIRILNEEKVLRTSLPGYTDYMKKVRNRLIPFIW